MASKTLKTRLKQKRDSSANWAKATNFIPLAGEIIVYSDLNMIKIGDGTTKVSALPFLKGDNAGDLANYVPYTGATKDVNLGEHSETLKNLIINGSAKLNGGFEPIKTYTFHTTGEYGVDYTLYIYSINGGSADSGSEAFFGRLDQHINGIGINDSSYIIGAFDTDGSTGKLSTLVGNLFSLYSTDLASQVYQHISASVLTSGEASVITETFAYSSQVSSLNDKINKLVPYTGADKDVNLGKHSLLISNKSGNTGNPTIKVSAKGVSEDDLYTIIAPNEITMGNPTTNTSTLSSNSLAVNDGGRTGAVIPSGFKASFDDGGVNPIIKYSTYEYDGIDHNGKKLAFPTKAGTIALLSDIPSLDGYVPYSGGIKDVVLEKNNSFKTSYDGLSATMEPTQVKLDGRSGAIAITYEGMFLSNSNGSTRYKTHGITVDGIEWLFPNVHEADGSTNVFVVRSDLKSLESDITTLKTDMSTKQAKLHSHTVLISDSNNKTAYLAFTAESERDLTIDSIENLIHVFRNRSIAVSGIYRDGDLENDEHFLKLNVGTSISNTTITTLFLTSEHGIDSINTVPFTDKFPDGTYTIEDVVP